MWNLLCSSQRAVMHNLIIWKRFIVLRVIRILLWTNISVAKTTAVFSQEQNVCLTRAAFSSYMCSESHRLLCSGWMELWYSCLLLLLLSLCPTVSLGVFLFLQLTRYLSLFCLNCLPQNIFEVMHQRSGFTTSFPTAPSLHLQVQTLQLQMRFTIEHAASYHMCMDFYYASEHIFTDISTLHIKPHISHICKEDQVWLPWMGHIMFLYVIQSPTGFYPNQATKIKHGFLPRDGFIAQLSNFLSYHKHATQLCNSLGRNGEIRAVTADILTWGSGSYSTQTQLEDLPLREVFAFLIVTSLNL